MREPTIAHSYAEALLSLAQKAKDLLNRLRPPER